MAIVGMQESTTAQDEQLLADIRETQQQICANFHADLGAAVGETHAGAADIRAAYQEALEALSYLRMTASLWPTVVSTMPAWPTHSLWRPSASSWT